MSTTVWHRGKARTFKDDQAAEPWLEEIKMAKVQKRTPKAPDEATAEAAPKNPTAQFRVSVPAACKNCGVTCGENNTGGFYVTHRSRGGNLISGSFRPGEDATAWLERVHGEES